VVEKRRGRIIVFSDFDLGFTFFVIDGRREVGKVENIEISA
jgi:hypothetical protein